MMKNLNKLYAFAKGYKKETVFACSFVALEVLFEVSIPFIMARLIDYGIFKNNVPYIWKSGLLLIAVSLISLVFGMVSAKFAATASSGFAKNLRFKMYSNIITFSYADIDAFKTSEIITRLTQDVNNLRNSYLMLIRVAMRSPIMFIFSISFAIEIAGKLSLIYVVLLPMLVVGLLVLMKTTAPMYKKVYEAYDKLNLTVQENLRGMKVVKSFSAGEREEEKFKNNTTEICRNFVKAEKLLAFSYPLMQLTVNISLVLISWFGAKMIVSGSLMTGELTSLISYSMQIFMSLRLFITVMSSLTQSSQTVRRVLSIVSYEAPKNVQNEALIECEHNDISLSHVSFAYGSSKNCLEDISLTIEGGSEVGIIGPTGSGKSTLAMIISGLYNPNVGKVLVNGHSIEEYNLTDIRENIICVLQESILFSGTIRENLVYGTEGKYTDDDLWNALRIAKADDFVKSFDLGLSFALSQSGSNLSGGQRQRLCIARAVLREPQVIIFDDSMSALDVTTEQKIRENLNRQLLGTTKIYISQRISAVKNCDKIIVLCSGKLESYDTHERLKEISPIYIDICNTQRTGGVVI